jgi:hypothetical protein
LFSPLGTSQLELPYCSFPVIVRLPFGLKVENRIEFNLSTIERPRPTTTFFEGTTLAFHHSRRYQIQCRMQVPPGLVQAQKYSSHVRSWFRCMFQITNRQPQELSSLEYTHFTKSGSPQPGTLSLSTGSIPAAP